MRNCLQVKDRGLVKWEHSEAGVGKSSGSNRRICWDEGL